MNFNIYTYKVQLLILIVVIPIFISCNHQNNSELSLNISEPEYELVWSDEFDYNGKPDPTKWGHELGFVRNFEAQYYTDSIRNARVKDGYLILEAHKEQIKNKEYKAPEDKDWRKNREFSSYSAPSLTTQDLAEFKYGRIEVKATLPRGEGLWPAIWMLGENWEEIGWPHCGGINIVEHVGFEEDSIFGSVQTESFNYFTRDERIEKVSIARPYSRFHIYAIEWTSEKIDFFLDGEKYYSFINSKDTKSEWPFDQKFHLKMNIAVGGSFGGIKGVEDEIFPQQMMVDYVRVYQKESIW